MSNLYNQNIGINYKGILNLDTTINTPLDATLRAVTDGMGTSSLLQLSTEAVGLSRTVNLSAGATTPRLFNVAYTINNSGAQTGTLTGLFLNATETALNGITHNLMDLQVGGVSMFNIGRTGIITSSGGIFSIGGGSVVLGNGALIYANGLVNGSLNYTSPNVWSFLNMNRINVGGTTSSFPSIKRNGAAIDFRLADDSDYAGIIYKTLLNSPTVSAGAVTFNCALADIFATTLVTGTPTAITLSNARAGSYVVNLKQPAGGSATVTWSTTIVWAGGTAPTLTTTANYLDVITLIYDGITWRGTATLNFAI